MTKIMPFLPLVSGLLMSFSSLDAFCVCNKVHTHTHTHECVCPYSYALVQAHLLIRDLGLYCNNEAHTLGYTPVRV